MDIQKIVATLEPLSSVAWWRVLIRQSAELARLQNESQKMHGAAYDAATAGDRPDRWQDYADESERHAEKYRQLTSQAWSIYWNAAREIRGHWPELLGELPIADGTTAEEIDPHIAARSIQGLIGRLLSQSPVEDGPCRNTWRMNGNEIADKMPPTAAALVRYVWSQRHRTVDVSSLAEPVFGDREKIVEMQDVQNHSKHANNFFKKHDIRWKVTTQSAPIGTVSIEPKG